MTVSSRPRPNLLALALALSAAALPGCQRRAWAPAEPPCTGEVPAPGEVVIAPLRCDGQLLGEGEGRTRVDSWVATSRYRLVLRHPLDALTAPGLGGGTVLDAAPWGSTDAVHEIVPIVAGGGLADTEMTLWPDHVEVTGTVAALPGQNAALPSAGERRTLRYRPDPDAPWLVVEGAEGFWIHPRGDETLLGGRMFAGGRVLGGVGEVRDYGGAFEIRGTDRLLISSDDEAFEALAGDDGVIVSGSADGAERLALYRKESRVGFIPLTAETFELRVPSAVDRVRGEANGRAPSPFFAPGPDLVLTPGPGATLEWRPVWEDGRPHWFRVRWTSPDGREGDEVLPPWGGTLPLGAGAFEMLLTAGPAFEPLALHLELAPDEQRVLPLRLRPTFDPGRYVLAGFRRPADRCRDWRGSDLTAGLLAAADGLSYATFTCPDDVASPQPSAPGFPLLALRNGVLLQGSGWSVASWPWPSRSKALHGAPRSFGDPSLDAAALTGGPDDHRLLHVDLGWLAQVGSPEQVEPAPDLVALGPPGEGLARWAPWFRWNDAQRVVVPTGPFTWVEVADPAVMGAQDVEQALAKGDVVAGTGPWLSLSVEGFGPGETLPETPPEEASTGDTGGPVWELMGSWSIAISVRNAPSDAHLALVSDGGKLDLLPLLPDQVVRRQLDGRWLALAVWSEDGAQWAVTSPIWTRAP